MHSLWIKRSSIAAVVALGAIGASAVPAAAHYATRCDRDGDNCYTVRCDDDGDNCQRVSSYGRSRYHHRRAYRNGYAYDNDNDYSDYNDENSDRGYRNHEDDDDE